jgi:predicted transglutaminase-like cysteine proteinase
MSVSVPLAKIFAAAVATLSIMAGAAEASSTIEDVDRTAPMAAPPAGLIAFCRRAPVACMPEDGDERDLAESLDRANALYWRVVFTRQGALPSEPAARSRQRGPQARRTRLANGLALARLSPALVIVHDGPAWANVLQVNRDVNRRIRETSDRRQFGQTDFWALPDMSDRTGARGDCEDFVLVKRALLISAGVPASALSIALGDTLWGDPHAVLLVATDKGEYVLDNLTPGPLHWSQAEIRWTSRQRPGELLSWVEIRGE